MQLVQYLESAASDRKVEKSRAGREMTHSFKGEFPGRKTSVEIDYRNKRVKGRERGMRGSRGSECGIKRKRAEESDVIDAGCCLLYVRETVERQAVLKWINYYSPLT